MGNGELRKAAYKDPSFFEMEMANNFRRIPSILMEYRTFSCTLFIGCRSDVFFSINRYSISLYSPMESAKTEGIMLYMPNYGTNVRKINRDDLRPVTIMGRKSLCHALIRSLPNYGMGCGHDSPESRDGCLGSLLGRPYCNRHDSIRPRSSQAECFRLASPDAISKRRYRISFAAMG